MRMDRTSGETAADLIDRVDEHELADLIYQFGEERRSRQVARAIVTARQQGRIETTARLAEIVRRAVAARGWQRIDPATRTFQALRIRVNGELDGLDSFIGSAAARLQAGAPDARRLRGEVGTGGRMALIAFHSLEDRVVKHTLRALSRGDDATLQLLTKHPVVATDAESAANPRARSAKLRAAVRV
jgi:16S rRNA (cytosine1402-N4)-methyltransferase